MLSHAIVFDDAFRDRLRDLLIWRRDVRHFRRDPLPGGTLEGLIDLACLAPSVGLSQPWRFVIVDDETIRAAIRRAFSTCNADALAAQAPERARLYAQLKLAGLEEAPCHLAVFADRATKQGHELGRRTMPEMVDYSAVTAIHTIWLAARAQGIGMGWVSILDPQAVAALFAGASLMEVHWLFLPRLSAIHGYCARAPASRMGTASLLISCRQTLGSKREMRFPLEPYFTSYSASRKKPAACVSKRRASLGRKRPMRDNGVHATCSRHNLIKQKERIRIRRPQPRERTEERRSAGDSSHTRKSLTPA